MAFTVTSEEVAHKALNRQCDAVTPTPSPDVASLKPALSISEFHELSKPARPTANAFQARKCLEVWFWWFGAAKLEKLRLRLQHNRK